MTKTARAPTAPKGEADAGLRSLDFALILHRGFDDVGDHDPTEDYVDVVHRVRSEEADW